MRLSSTLEVLAAEGCPMAKVCIEWLRVHPDGTAETCGDGRFGAGYPESDARQWMGVSGAQPKWVTDAENLVRPHLAPP